MSSVKQLAKDFESLNYYPLKSDSRTKKFTTDDKLKQQFLQSVSDFVIDNPNLNFYELGQEIKRNNKKNRYFDKRFEGLIDFLNNPKDIKSFDKMLTGFQKQEELKQEINDNFKPFNFPEIDVDEKVIYIKPTPKKDDPKKDEASKGMGAGAISESDIKEVLAPRMRGSVQAKQAKEQEQKKQRDPTRAEDIITKVEKAQEIEKKQKQKEEKLKKVKTDSMGNVIESEDDPRVFDPSQLTTKELEELTGMTVEEIELSRKGKNIIDDDDDDEEEKEEERPPPATATPATMSPDERDEAIGLSTKSLDDMIKKMEEQMEAEEDAKKKELLRQQIEKAKAEAEEKRKTDIATMTLGKGSATGKVEEIKIQDVPQDIRAIPKERASTTGKSEAQLKDDINYFFKTYPDMLKKQKGQFMTILRGKSPALRKKQLIELHRRIVGLVGSVEEKDIGKKIGIVLNADKYLDDKINAILLQKITEGLTPASLVVDVTDKTKDDKSKRIGSYQITKGRSGLLNAQKAPVYRSIPSTNDSQDRRSNRPIKLKTLPTQRWDEVNTAKKQMRLDPFEGKREKVNRFDIYL